MVKRNIGDLVQVDDYKNKRKWILEIKWKSFKKLKGDILPHRYYSGNIIPLVLNEETYLYSPNENVGSSYKSYIRSSSTSTINTSEIDLKKLIPHFDFYTKKN